MKIFTNMRLETARAILKELPIDVGAEPTVTCMDTGSLYQRQQNDVLGAPDVILWADPADRDYISKVMCDIWAPEALVWFVVPIDDKTIRIEQVLPGTSDILQVTDMDLLPEHNLVTI